MYLNLKKAEKSTPERMVWAEVYAPDRPDSGHDFMSAEDIKKAAYEFIRKGRVGQIDLMHNNVVVTGASVVESFIAREDDKVFIPGSWVVGMHVDNDEVWALIEKGEINGFSLEALAKAQKMDVEVEVPPVVSGDTSESDGHSHKFYVSYDNQGIFQGGRTDTVNDHFHVIKAGTVTEKVGEHSHRFSSVDNLLIINED